MCFGGKYNAGNNPYYAMFDAASMKGNKPSGFVAHRSDLQKNFGSMYKKFGINMSEQRTTTPTPTPTSSNPASISPITTQPMSGVRQQMANRFGGYTTRKTA